MMSMMDSSLPMGIVERITPQDARSYALAKGWQRSKGIRDDIAIFRSPEPGSRKQLIVPMDPSYDDYGSRMAEVVEKLAAVEGRPVQEVLNDLLAPSADVLRYRVVSPATDRGSLPLGEAVRLLEGVKMSLLSAAHSVLSPQRHHPRMSRSEAVQLVDACSLGQTERGSFTVAITCPLHAVELYGSLFDREQPFTRRATSLLMRSAVRLVKAIEADEVGTVLDEQAGEPMLSANLCDALLHMQPAHERSSLALSATWASTLPPDPAAEPPRQVRLRHEYFPIIEEVYRTLRAASEPREALFVGMVDTLNGNVGDGGRVRGEVVVSLLHDEEAMKARLELDADDYETALEAHRAGDAVKLTGVLHRGRRLHRITAVRGFARIGR
jgi:hypothetical protein